MTILRDLYQSLDQPGSIDEQGKRSQQGVVDDLTLLNGGADDCFRPTSAEAKRAMEQRAGETLFLADWVDAVFLHFEVSADLLQPEVPFKLDQFEGRCFVSFVAFTMRRLRFKAGGRLTRWITAPVANHRFLNLRTYVRHKDGPGIFFMKEWLDNRLAVKLGPATFGLPYHSAKLDYDHDSICPTGRVETEDGILEYGGGKSDECAPALPGSLNEFLLERYIAYTSAGRRRKFFRVWHRPWEVAEMTDITLDNQSLLEGLKGAWVKGARLQAAHQTTGVTDVWMSRPHWVT